MFTFTVPQVRIPENACMFDRASARGFVLVVRPPFGKHWNCREEIYGLSGNTYPVKDTLKAAGWRFDGASKCWFAPSESVFLSTEF